MDSGYAELPDEVDTTDDTRIAPGEPVNGPNEHHLEHSAAHFQSEQDLFHHTPSTSDAGQDFIDVASFLEMGHVPNCWCRPCQDMYDHEIEKDSAALVDPNEDEWMVCSSGSGTRSPSSCSAWEWEWEWGTLVNNEDNFGGTTGQTCSTKDASTED